MTKTDTRKVAVGLALLGVSSVLIFAAGVISVTPTVIAVIAGTLGLAAGALLVGTSDPGRPV